MGITPFALSDPSDFPSTDQEAGAAWLTEWQPLRACRVRGMVFPCPAKADVAIIRFYGKAWRNISGDSDELIWRGNPTDNEVSDVLVSSYTSTVERMATPSPPLPKCLVSDWKVGNCSLPCLRGIRKVTRRVLQSNSGQSQPCPQKLVKTLRCSPEKCHLKTEPVSVTVSQAGPTLNQTLTATAIGNQEIRAEAKNGMLWVELTHPEKDALIKFTLYSTEGLDLRPFDLNYPTACFADSSVQRCSSDDRWYDCGCSKCTLQKRCATNAGLHDCACPIQYPYPYQPTVLSKFARDRVKTLPRKLFQCEHNYNTALLLSSKPNRYFLSSCVVVPQRTNKTCGMWSLTTIQVTEAASVTMTARRLAVFNQRAN